MCICIICVHALFMYISVSFRNTCMVNGGGGRGEIKFTNRKMRRGISELHIYLYMLKSMSLYIKTIKYRTRSMCIM